MFELKRRISTDGTTHCCLICHETGDVAPNELLFGDCFDCNIVAELGTVKKVRLARHRRQARAQSTGALHAVLT